MNRAEEERVDDPEPVQPRHPVQPAGQPAQPDAGHPLQPAGHPLQPAGHPLQPAATGHPLQPAATGHPLQPAAAGHQLQPAAGQPAQAMAQIPQFVPQPFPMTQYQPFAGQLLMQPQYFQQPHAGQADAAATSAGAAFMTSPQAFQSAAGPIMSPSSPAGGQQSLAWQPQQFMTPPGAGHFQSPGATALGYMTPPSSPSFTLPVGTFLGQQEQHNRFGSSRYNLRSASVPRVTLPWERRERPGRPNAVETALRNLFDLGLIQPPSQASDQAAHAQPPPVYHPINHPQMQFTNPLPVAPQQAPPPPGPSAGTVLTCSVCRSPNPDGVLVCGHGICRPCFNRQMSTRPICPDPRCQKELTNASFIAIR